MKRLLYEFACAVLVLGLAGVASAANKTMTGSISDSMCGASHAKMIAAHPQAHMTDRDCALACVKAGAKYVFVSSGKVYQIANQDFAALQKDAGETVHLTGDVNGDTITVKKLAMAKRQ